MLVTSKPCEQPMTCTYSSCKLTDESPRELCDKCHRSFHPSCCPLEFGRGCACHFLVDLGKEDAGDPNESTLFSSFMAEHQYEVGEEVLVNHSFGPHPTMEHGVVSQVLDSHIMVCDYDFRISPICLKGLLPTRIVASFRVQWTRPNDSSLTRTSNYGASTVGWRQIPHRRTTSHLRDESLSDGWELAPIAASRFHRAHHEWTDFSDRNTFGDGCRIRKN